MPGAVACWSVRSECGGKWGMTTPRAISTPGMLPTAPDWGHGSQHGLWRPHLRVLFPPLPAPCPGRLAVTQILLEDRRIQRGFLAQRVQSLCGEVLPYLLSAEASRRPQPAPGSEAVLQRVGALPAKTSQECEPCSRSRTNPRCLETYFLLGQEDVVPLRRVAPGSVQPGSAPWSRAGARTSREGEWERVCTWAPPSAWDGGRHQFGFVF